MDFLTALRQALDERVITDQIYAYFEELYRSYERTFERDGLNIATHQDLFKTYLEKVEEQLKTPYHFEPFHKRVTAPFDFYRFGVDFFRPLMDLEKSSIQKVEIFQKIRRQIAAKENVILLANHQTEIDPQLMSVAFEKIDPLLVAETIFVAGDRVTKDPMAIPFSMGRNLLCIYSKRHVAIPPEKKAEKLEHNQRAMRVLRRLFDEGGKCIYVAPSGGRDRPGADGTVEVSPFDPNSVEIFRLITKRSSKPAHFYPMALATYDTMPPPKIIELELGEWRNANRAGVQFSFGDEVDMDNFPGHELKDRPARREALASHIWNLLKTEYASF
ncbi:MAG: hypothetical protein KR126chlam2_01176 [Chlamydiae bacterium]|nr:hypothetical protein [Chlamydiota bacterium]